MSAFIEMNPGKKNAGGSPHRQNITERNSSLGAHHALHGRQGILGRDHASEHYKLV
jgi:hypothetical protein